MQIKHKILLAFLAFVVIPFVIVGSFSSGHASEVTKKQVGDALYRLAKQNGITVERSLYAMNEKTLKFIEEHFTEGAKSPVDLRGISNLSQYNTVNDLISKYTLDGTEYALFVPYSNEEQTKYTVSSGKASGLIYTSPDDLPPYYEEAAALKGRGIIRYVSFGDAVPSVCFVRAVMDPHESRVLGVLYVMNLEVILYSDIWSSQIPSGSGIYVLNERSEILTSMPEAESGTKLELPAAIDLPGNVSRFMDWHGRETFFTAVYQSHFDTRLVYEVPVKAMVGEQQAYQRVLLIVMVLCFLFVAGYLLYMLGLVLNPLYKLTRMTEKYEPGMTFSTGPAFGRKDEIGKVYGSFHRMTERVNQMVEERYELEMRNQRMELMTLHTQITPHLLYNTLDSIYWMAIDKDESELARMVNDLSSLLRIGLSRGKELVAVREELLHIQAYVRLQLQRYNDAFRVNWEIDEALLDKVTPKVVLQPLVENAILHGVGKMDGEGEIWIRIGRHEEMLSLIVEDNGFKPADPDELNAMTDNEEGAGYGARNVHRRIVLHFGPRYGLRYSRRPGGGTVAELRLPLESKEQNVG